MSPWGPKPLSPGSPLIRNNEEEVSANDDYDDGYHGNYSRNEDYTDGWGSDNNNDIDARFSSDKSLFLKINTLILNGFTWPHQMSWPPDGIVDRRAQ